MPFLLLLITFFSFSANAECLYVKDSGQVKWTAYKTAKKVGVEGLLEDYEYKPNKGTNLHQVITNSTFKIEGSRSSVSTGKWSRDLVIASSFFKKLFGGPMIKGTFVSMGKKVLTVEINFNEEKHVLDMPFTFDGEKLVAKGQIHLLDDFKAGRAYESLGKACESKHEGKTWPEVALEVSAEFKDCSL